MINENNGGCRKFVQLMNLWKNIGKRHEKKQSYVYNKKKKQECIIEQEKLVNKLRNFFMNIIIKEKD